MSTIVEHYNGGIVVVGGLDGLGIARSDLFYLASPESDWVTLTQRLKIPRFYHTAFLIHNSLVKCT